MSFGWGWRSIVVRGRVAEGRGQVDRSHLQQLGSCSHCENQY